MSADPDDALDFTSPACTAVAKSKSARCFEVKSPYDGTVVGHAPDIDCGAFSSSLDDGGRAASALQCTSSIQGRLRSWAARIEAQRDQLARIISSETGKPIRFARFEVARAVEVLNSSANCPAVPLVRDGVGSQSVFSILNWCDPVLSTVREATSVLTSGQALVIKPSSRAPLASRFLASLWTESDALDALLCVTPSRDAIGMLRAALMSSRTSEVRFQGSRDAASFVSSACHEAAVPVTTRANDRLPLVVHAGANVLARCDAVIRRAYLQPLLTGSGRISCLWVHDSLADALMSELVERVGRLRVGDPLDEDTDIGPVIDDVATVLISEQLEDALSEGAMVSGGTVNLDGRQLRPIVLDHANPFMRVCIEEAEGPLLPVIRFNHLSELPDTAWVTTDSLDSSVRFERPEQSTANPQGAGRFANFFE